MASGTQLLMTIKTEPVEDGDDADYLPDCKHVEIMNRLEDKSIVLTQTWSELSSILAEYKSDLYSARLRRYNHSTDDAEVFKTLKEKENVITDLRSQLEKLGVQRDIELSVKNGLLKRYQQDLIQKEVELLNSSQKISKLEARIRELEFKCCKPNDTATSESSSRTPSPTENLSVTDEVKPTMVMSAIAGCDKPLAMDVENDENLQALKSGMNNPSSILDIFGSNTVVLDDNVYEPKSVPVLDISGSSTVVLDDAVYEPKSVTVSTKQRTSVAGKVNPKPQSSSGMLTTLYGIQTVRASDDVTSLTSKALGKYRPILPRTSVLTAPVIPPTAVSVAVTAPTCTDDLKPSTFIAQTRPVSRMTLYRWRKKLGDVTFSRRADVCKTCGTLASDPSHAYYKGWRYCPEVTTGQTIEEWRNDRKRIFAERKQQKNKSPT